jgi:hypothetical protein
MMEDLMSSPVSFRSVVSLPDDDSPLTLGVQVCFGQQASTTIRLEGMNEIVKNDPSFTVDFGKTKERKNKVLSISSVVADINPVSDYLSINVNLFAGAANIFTFQFPPVLRHQSWENFTIILALI